MKKLVLLVLTTLLIIILGCAKKTNDNSLIIEPPLYPSCIKNIIDSSLAKPKGSIVTTIYQAIYKNALVFYMISGCCDKYNPVYDANCNLLFSPSGGITGGGDGTHPDFFKDATLDTIPIWKDPR